MATVICDKYTCVFRSEHGKCTQETVELTDGGDDNNGEQYLICELYKGGR